VPVILSGCSLLGWPPGGLYWLVAGVLLAILVATANAWVLLVEVVRDERYRPLEVEPPS
jgi:modulator of FtsH protease